MKIKTGDTVKVISGHYKGTTGEVKAVSPKKHKIIVEGVNIVKQSLKPTQANPDGGIVEREAAIDISNVMLYDSKAKKAGRVGFSTGKKGEKVRINKGTGKEVKEAKK
ncbi:MAG: 50S ribosomal protein L24 [Solobacterium sp.]|nr:50S ribosomal protein L24 [Solobacterium sp.]